LDSNYKISEFGLCDKKGEKESHLPENHPPRLIVISHALSSVALLLLFSLSLSLSVEKKREKHLRVTTLCDDDGSVLVVLRVNTLKKW
jgi:hypothetical protein